MEPRAFLPFILALILVSAWPSPAAAPIEPGSPSPAAQAAAAQAVNQLGCELLTRGTPADANALLSPYSIQSALAMTFAGAAGDTHAEMARVLHYPADEAQLHESFAALKKAFEDLAHRTVERAAAAQRRGDPAEPVTLTVANRLFGQAGFDVRAPFLALAADLYGAPFQPMDFAKQTAEATRAINLWVEESTSQRIRDLIPAGALDAETRLVLVNAIHLKAPWANAFPATATTRRPFQVAGSSTQEVPTMVREGHFGYERRDGYQVVTIPYLGGELQFLVLLPDDPEGWAALETRLTPELLASCARPPMVELVLNLPKVKLEPPLLRLGETLRSLGMNLAFDQPRGSADFDRMAPRKPEDDLRIAEVFHQTFLDLDEKGTEAAAATAVAMVRVTSARIERPIEVRVDHPFLFAIQHRASATCLFLGRLLDPR
jgi:serpin B